LRNFLNKNHCDIENGRRAGGIQTTFLEADSLEITLNQRCPNTPTFFVKEAPFVASHA
jgi:hypothetical protein